jgi:hypothetical protein
LKKRTFFHALILLEAWLSVKRAERKKNARRLNGWRDDETTL